MSDARSFWIKQVNNAVELMNDNELANLANLFQKPGAKFILEIIHGPDRVPHSAAFIITELRAEDLGSLLRAPDGRITEEPQ